MMNVKCLARGQEWCSTNVSYATLSSYAYSYLNLEKDFVSQTNFWNCKEMAKLAFNKRWQLLLKTYGLGFGET